MASRIAHGVVLAAVAAVAFGVTTPIVAWAGHTTGVFFVAALLYAGAALAATVLRLASHTDGGPLQRADRLRVVVVALAGGAVAPTLLAWGLQRTGATVGSLLLNLEAVFTVLLARAVYRESIGSRVAIAVAAMVAGGAALTLDMWGDAAWSLPGIVAVAGATAAWALDNTLSRPLAERDPLSVVTAKGTIGALITVTAALIAGEPWPPLAEALALLACGATGYGLSLRLYLLAQRTIGAARTGSVFALAPFVGAALAIRLGDRLPGPWTAVAAALFATGVYLHVSERHHHAHVHAQVDHDHAHRHDDDHHDHAHDPPFTGEHSHPHHHEQLEHDHDHGPDADHDHAH